MDQIADGFKGERAIVVPYSIRSFQSENELTKNLFVTHIGYYPNAKYHFRKRSKGALENILIYCENGKGSITFENEQFSLTKDQAFIIPAHKAHSYEAEISKPWSIYWLHFKGLNTSLHSSISGKIINLSDTRSSDRLNLFEEIYQNLEMGFSPDNLEYSSICLQHFLASIKYTDQFLKIKTADAEVLDIIPMSIIYMKNNLTTKITLHEIAQHVGYSSSYFGTLFLEKTSSTPMDYYNQLKIQKSCSLLQFSTMKIKEIAYHLGYYDPFHFSKSFRVVMEISPREYRLRYKTQAQSS
ncbi:AraC-like protein [Flavobacterium cutihirudinis]|uniref:AraC-like protein n=1 Tax=Flavobacterium cutihirudinis TaxID=1265740 RepID=A0A3D9FRW2_9FLAO|nr:AraC family transcriptional regulator [Flavobacterium cutihirudinis]RED22515.1 AraC-like protein [Flavobacterium cutihirudinis]